MISYNLLLFAILITTYYISALFNEFTQSTYTIHELHLRHKRKEVTRTIPSQQFSNHMASNQFVLNCPNVQDAHLEQVKVQATWTKDETIWLKIRNGERLLSNKPTAFHRKIVGNKSILHIKLNNGRYIFLYDETTGNFSMTISPVSYPEDTGLWQCHVTVRKNGKMQSMTSRNRVRDRQQKPSDMDSERSIHDYPYKSDDEIARNEDIKSKAAPIKAFNRNDQSAIEIARHVFSTDPKKKRSKIIFNV